MKPAQYVLVRYNADPGRNELLNVGAIVWDGIDCRVAVDADAVARVVRENPRLDRNSLLYLQLYLEESLADVEVADEEAMRRWLIAQKGFPVAYTEPRFTTLGPGGIDESLARIVSRSVAPRRRSSVSGETPVQALEEHLRPLLRSQRVVRHHAFLGGKSSVAWSADFFVNHGVDVAVDALQLDISRGEEIRRRAAAQAYKVEDALLGSVREYLVYCAMPTAADATDAATTALQILKSAGAQVLDNPAATLQRVYEFVK